MNTSISTTYTSPNRAERHGASIRMLVIHATAGPFWSSLNWLLNPASRVSAHYLISKPGRIYRLVDERYVAWHAGASAWRGMGSDLIALSSIGIELVNDNTGKDPYPAEQLAAATWLCKTLIARHHIDRSMVVRHLDIAVPTGRKSDPAGLPWATFVSGLYDNPAPTPPPQIGRYKVRAAVTAGATIRSAPRRNAAVLGRLRAGDSWQGGEVWGEKVTLAGFGTSDIWIVDERGRAVWSGLLEEVR